MASDVRESRDHVYDTLHEETKLPRTTERAVCRHFISVRLSADSYHWESPLLLLSREQGNMNGGQNGLVDDGLEMFEGCVKWTNSNNKFRYENNFLFEFDIS